MRPVGGVVEAHQELDDRGLAAAARTDQRQRLPLVERERHVLAARGSCLPGYAKLTSSNSTRLERFELDRVRRILDLGARRRAARPGARRWLSISLIWLIWREMGCTVLIRFCVSVSTSRMSPGVCLPSSAPQRHEPDRGEHAERVGDVERQRGAPLDGVQHAARDAPLGLGAVVALLDRRLTAEAPHGGDVADHLGEQARHPARRAPASRAGTAWSSPRCGARCRS